MHFTFIYANKLSQISFSANVERFALLGFEIDCASRAVVLRLLVNNFAVAYYANTVTGLKLLNMF